MLLPIVTVLERHLFTVVLSVVLLGIAVGLSWWIWLDRANRFVPAPGDLVELSGLAEAPQIRNRPSSVWFRFKASSGSPREAPLPSELQVRVRDTGAVASALKEGPVRVVALVVKAELGRGPEMEPVLANRVTEQTVRSYMHRRPGREVRLELQEGLPSVIATQSYIDQVVRNLVSNADKYSPPTAPIVVRTFAPDERNVAIQVLDEGPGLGDTEPERLFERFYRSRETQNVASGLGLGLTVCKRLVEAMGGTITAHKRPERGLEFTVTLPNSEEEA